MDVSEEGTAKGIERWKQMIDLSLKVTRGDATMLYATCHGSYTSRLHLRLDQRIDGQKLRIAVDKAAQRYPYFCVSLKRNEREFYYEEIGRASCRERV